jgi:hypothetical protein
VHRITPSQLVAILRHPSMTFRPTTCPKGRTDQGPLVYKPLYLRRTVSRLFTCIPLQSTRSIHPCCLHCLHTGRLQPTLCLLSSPFPLYPLLPPLYHPLLVKPPHPRKTPLPLTRSLPPVVSRDRCTHITHCTTKDTITNQSITRIWVRP